VVEVPRAFVRRPSEPDVRHPWRPTRCALLLAGGATLLAGCGKDDEAAAPSPVDAMRRQLTAERRLAATLVALRDGDDRALLGRLTDRSLRRVRTLAASLSSQGAPHHDTGEPAGRPEPAEALRLGRATLTEYVTGLPAQTGSLRELGADLVAESAGDLALLGSLYGAASEDPFPGTPA
jgi:hypothetical protein